jgi:hypothetical protein
MWLLSEKALGLFGGLGIIGTYEGLESDKMSVVSDGVSSIFCHRERPYLGGDSPGDDTHSFMRDAASSWRALSRKASRSLP